jgi:DNA polymerase III epsilon subunit-like protein
MTWDDLKGKPRFEDVAAEFIAFATGAEWIIHQRSVRYRVSRRRARARLASRVC